MCPQRDGHTKTSEVEQRVVLTQMYMIVYMYTFIMHKLFLAGFGALIRAVGSRANRSNNKEACRDLSGRRLRDVNAQKK